MLMVAFRFYLTSSMVETLTLLPPNVLEVDVVVTPGWGIFGFTLGVMGSLLVNHVMIWYHRKVIRADEDFQVSWSLAFNFVLVLIFFEDLMTRKFLSNVVSFESIVESLVTSSFFVGQSIRKPDFVVYKKIKVISFAPKTCDIPCSSRGRTNCFLFHLI
jgi:hypothetical protein